MPSENKKADFKKTPLYRALRSDRYSRQELIISIEKITNRALIIYEANLWRPGSSLGEDDIQPFGDLLCRLSEKENVDLLIHSPGGDIDATEKIIEMYQNLERDDINLLMLNGCIISWYNVIDLHTIADETQRPLLCVT